MISIFFLKGAIVFSRSYYGHGIGPNLISSLSCTGGGKDESLLDCSFDYLYALLNCGDGSVAGAVCLGKQINIVTFIMGT